MIDKQVLGAGFYSLPSDKLEFELLYPAELEIHPFAYKCCNSCENYTVIAHLGPNLTIYVGIFDKKDAKSAIIEEILDRIEDLQSNHWDECFDSTEQYNAFKKYVRLA